MDEISIQDLCAHINKRTADEKQMIVKEIPIQILFNELERRELERIELIHKLDEINKFLGGITR